MVETIASDGQQLALIVRGGFSTEGVQFFTLDADTLQLGYLNRPAGHVIPPHAHRPVKREIEFTKEVLFIRSGLVRVDFYAEDQRYLQSALLRAGDVVLLSRGGHGFEVLEQAELLEVKQGPYAGDQDRTRFAPVAAGQVVVRAGS